MGIFKFLKKEKKKSSKEVNLPFVTRTENVNKTLTEFANKNNIPLSSLDFELLSYSTYIKIGTADFIEADEETIHLIHKEEFLLNPENEIKQSYEIKIKRYELLDDFELIGDMVVNKNFTEAKFIIGNQSLLLYNEKLEERIIDELNKKKLRNGLLINLFDEKMRKDVEKFIAKIRVLGELEDDYEVLLCKGIEPVKHIEGKIILHFKKNKETIKKKLLYPVRKGEILIEIIKPKEGRNGRDCRGKAIIENQPKEFEIPQIEFDKKSIEKKEDNLGIYYIALKDGYIYKDSGVYYIEDEMKVKQINLKTGDVVGAENSDVKLEVREKDVLKEAIADNMVVETTELIVRGNVGNSAKVKAKKLEIHGQTHKKSKIFARNAEINIHKGILKAKEARINRLEGGRVIADKVVVSQAIGGEIIAKEVRINTLGSHLKVYALNLIEITNLVGQENLLSISPEKVLGDEVNISVLEKKLKEIEQNISIKFREYKKRRETILRNRSGIEELKKLYLENKKKGLKTSQNIIKKIKEFEIYKNKFLELKSEIEELKRDKEIILHDIDSVQNSAYLAKIISYSPWREFNRIEFDLIEPPVKLTYDTKGNEGICGFKLKDLGDDFKIVKIKVEDDIGS